jgi:S1-C subfamily serine protease
MSSPRIAAFLGAVAGALLVGVVALVLAAAGVVEVGDEAPASARVESSSGPVAGTTAAVSATAPDVADLYQQARPGVVDIRARGVGTGLTRGDAGGSGFVLDTDGHILTNEHVVEGARSVQVRFEGQRSPLTAKVVGQDASTDLALLKVDPADVRSGLHPLKLGSSHDLRVGETAVALGSPFGLTGTLTTGVISALDRSITAPNGFTIDGVVQTDAAINPGNSGGPLLNGGGEVIGVNAQIATNGAAANSGVGFAIPADVAREVIPKLQKDGKIDRAWLGVSTGERPSGAAGAVVGRVVPSSPAAKAGLRTGDVIVRADGAAVTQPDDIAQAIADNKPGDDVKLTYRRDGDERSATVTLGTRPDEVQG